MLNSAYVGQSSLGTFLSVWFFLIEWALIWMQFEFRIEGIIWKDLDGLLIHLPCIFFLFGLRKTCSYRSKLIHKRSMFLIQKRKRRKFCTCYSIPFTFQLMFWTKIIYLSSLTSLFHNILQSLWEYFCLTISFVWIFGLGIPLWTPCPSCCIMLFSSFQ